MTRYPKGVRDAAIKCLPCNAPAVMTIGGDYVCVECASILVSSMDSVRQPRVESTSATMGD